MNEIWKSTGFDGYEVSNLGRVRRLHKTIPPRIRKLTTDTHGYLHVNLWHGGKSKHFSIHRLVAIAFIPNPENKPEVNHIDGNKLNNRVSNLEWVTSSENQRHAFDMGLQVALQGEDAPRAKLTAEQVIYIRGNPDGLTCKQLAEMFNVSRVTIGDVQRGVYYRNVGGKIRDSL